MGYGFVLTREPNGHENRMESSSGMSLKMTLFSRISLQAAHVLAWRGEHSQRGSWLSATQVLGAGKLRTTSRQGLVNHQDTLTV